MTALRSCLREPILEIWLAAKLLDKAVNAHIAGDYGVAATLVLEANMPDVRAWTESVWGKSSPGIHDFRTIPEAPPYLPKHLRPRPRMPTLDTQRKVIERDGHYCRFCGIPVISPKVRERLHQLYPDAAKWGASNKDQHAAFQCMWLQFDHVLPNSRGGASSLENIIITCAACNFGRMEHTLEEAGLIDPRLNPLRDHSAFVWDGLDRPGLR